MAKSFFKLQSDIFDTLTEASTLERRADREQKQADMAKVAAEQDRKRRRAREARQDYRRDRKRALEMGEEVEQVDELKMPATDDRGKVTNRKIKKALVKGAMRAVDAGSDAHANADSAHRRGDKEAFKRALDKAGHTNKVARKRFKKADEEVEQVDEMMPHGMNLSVGSLKDNPSMIAYREKVKKDHEARMKRLEKEREAKKNNESAELKESFEFQFADKETAQKFMREISQKKLGSSTGTSDGKVRTEGPAGAGVGSPTRAHQQMAKIMKKHGGKLLRTDEGPRMKRVFKEDVEQVDEAKRGVASAKTLRDFKKEIKNYYDFTVAAAQDRDAKKFAKKDQTDLTKLHDMIKQGKIKQAQNFFDKLDSAVQEVVPRSVTVVLDEAFDKLTPAQERDAERRLKPTRGTVAKVRLRAGEKDVAKSVKAYQDAKGGNPGNTKKRRLRDLRLRDHVEHIDEKEGTYAAKKRNKRHSARDMRKAPDGSPTDGYYAKGDGSHAPRKPSKYSALGRRRDTNPTYGDLQRRYEDVEQVDEMSAKAHYKKYQAKFRVPPIDRNRYPNREREGLEGPYRSKKSGKVFYYDTKAGKYYDTDSDMYLQVSDVMEAKKEKIRIKLDPKKKIGYEVRSVGPGGKTTVTKRRDMPDKEDVGEGTKPKKKKITKSHGDYPKDTHMCVTHAEHTEWGLGTAIHGEHAEPDENGYVSWYNMMFEHGIERVNVEDVTVLELAEHENHDHHHGEDLKEMFIPRRGSRYNPASGSRRKTHPYVHTNPHSGEKVRHQLPFMTHKHPETGEKSVTQGKSDKKTKGIPLRKR